jgi:crotonobetainyl-CoA:carnitine CoA-transferase CaiB-like acyl-CoA transferase
VIADPLSSVVAATVIAAWAVGPARDEGAVVDLSMAEVVASTISEFVAAASAEGSRHGVGVHRGVFRTADGRWLAVELTDPEDWWLLAEALGVSDISGEDEIASLVAAASGAELAARLADNSVSAALVQRADELVGDPHLAARDFFPEIDHPDLDIGRARLVGLPWRFVGEGPVTLGPPPALGNANALYERLSDAI